MGSVDQDLRLEPWPGRENFSLLENIPYWGWAQVSSGATGQGIKGTSPTSMSSLDQPYSLHNSSFQTRLCIRMQLR